MDEFPKDCTIDEKYDGIFDVETPEEAGQYFRRCVSHTMLVVSDRAMAEEIERHNIGIHAGYSLPAEAARVRGLFGLSVTG